MQRTVLVIDDDENDVLLTTMALRRIEPELGVEAAFSGEAGLALLMDERELPALVLLDLKMPGMGGLAALRKIRGDERLKGIPVVVVTSSSLEADMEETREAGADRFLRKGFDDQFHRDMEAVLKRWVKP